MGEIYGTAHELLDSQIGLCDMECTYIITHRCQDTVNTSWLQTGTGTCLTGVNTKHLFLLLTGCILTFPFILSINSDCSPKYYRYAPYNDVSVNDGPHIRWSSHKIITLLYNNIILRGTLLVAQLVEALRYKPEGSGFDSRWCHWNFPLT